MRAALGYDRQTTTTEMGATMLNVSLANARAAMYARTEMTDAEIVGDYSATPAVTRPTIESICAEEDSAGFVESVPFKTRAALIADGSEWVEFRCANWGNCGRSVTDVVIIDSYDGESEMHVCKGCFRYLYEGAKAIRTRPGMDENLYESMRNFLALKSGGYRPVIKVIADRRNNVGRMCSYNSTDGRVWRIMVPMQDQNFTTYYVLENVETGKRVIAWDQLLHNLY